MLFSSSEVAQSINSRFEPVWVNVRDVPMVTIDFGGGHKIVRTLNGNIATYICRTDGRVLDVIPGIYEPKTYAQRLNEAWLLHRFVKQKDQAGKSDPIAEYHRSQLISFDQAGMAGRLTNDGDRSKLFVENPIKFVAGVKAKDSTGPETGASKADERGTPADLAKWKILAEDTQMNETVRRRAIHAILAAGPVASPDAIKSRVYKHVLNADIDDPYLGLGDLLNKSYVFADEEKK